MASTQRDHEEDDAVYVPIEVIDGIEDIAEGRTADAENLDDALEF